MCRRVVRLSLAHALELLLLVQPHRALLQPRREVRLRRRPLRLHVEQLAPQPSDGLRLRLPLPLVPLGRARRDEGSVPLPRLLEARLAAGGRRRRRRHVLLRRRLCIRLQLLHPTGVAELARGADVLPDLTVPPVARLQRLPLAAQRLELCDPCRRRV